MKEPPADAVMTGLFQEFPDRQWRLNARNDAAAALFGGGKRQLLPSFRPCMLWDRPLGKQGNEKPDAHFRELLDKIVKREGFFRIAAATVTGVGCSWSIG
jgi:hypothetical protein